MVKKRDLFGVVVVGQHILYAEARWLAPPAFVGFLKLLEM